MERSKECFVDLQEKYEKVKKLLDEDSKHDPENAPYASKYAARKILTSMKTNLVNMIDSSSQNNLNCHKLTAMLGAVWLNMGVISIETEELSTGEEQLMNCIRCLNDDSLHPQYILVILNALNQLGVLWSHHDEPLKSKEFLERAEKLFNEFKTTKRLPIDITDLFKYTTDNENLIDAGFLNIEKTHTHTLYYLAQIYGNLKEFLKSAIYLHITLKRQLESKDFEPIDWALNAATLSQFFIEKNLFKQSRHHLAAASFILDAYEKDLEEVEEAEEILNAKKERFRHRSADVARCWAKYGIQLLNMSRERLMSRTEDENDSVSTLFLDLVQLQLDLETTVSRSDLENLHFPMELLTYEEPVTDQLILTFDNARAVFLNTQSWLNKAKEYYTLDHHASDHVIITQDISELYKYLAFFEEDEERQCKMHKRRIDHLEAVVKELNPKYYLLVCRQMWYEIAEIYSEILHMKLDKLRSTAERPSPHALKKINTSAENSIKYFNLFLDSIKSITTNEMPTKIPEDLVKPALRAYFHIGRLYEKIITLDKRVQLQNTKNAYDAYQKIISYCVANESASELIKLEYRLCEEVVQLLKIKIQRLTNDIEN